jgi:hypothetical protein
MTERSTVEILQAARERISDPERWTTYASARDRKGTAVRPSSPQAVRWDVVGALKSEALGDADAFLGARRFLRLAAGARRISSVGDSGHSASLAMYDRAIDLAGAAS